MKPTTHILEGPDSLFRATGERFIELAQQSIETRGSFHVALAGGSTPVGLYRYLAKPEQTSRLDWSRTHVYFGDERCVPPTHESSNFRVARETLLDHVPLPPHQIHRIRGEAPPHEAAAEYDHELAAYLPKDEEQNPRFDLVLLGMGPDGHVASLFPDTDILRKHKALASEVFVPKLDSWRISLTFPIIDWARHIVLLVSGDQKAHAVRHVFQSQAGASALPVQMLRPRGVLEWYLDTDAAHYLEETEQE